MLEGRLKVLKRLATYCKIAFRKVVVTQILTSVYTQPISKPWSTVSIIIGKKGKAAHLVSDSDATLF